MAEKNLLDEKKVLVVDDEQDVLDTLAELLPMCEVSKAVPVPLERTSSPHKPARQSTPRAVPISELSFARLSLYPDA